MVENKWAEITEAVNALGGGMTKLTSEQIFKKIVRFKFVFFL